MTQADIVFLNSLAWGSPVPSPGKRVASGLAARHRVLYIDPAQNVLRAGRGDRRRVDQQAWVQASWRAPVYFAGRWDRVAAPLLRLNARLLAAQVMAGAHALEMRQPIICNAFVPAVSVSICDQLDSSTVIYFVTDALDGMEEPRALGALEKDWVDRADCIVCTSESLAERFARPGRRVELIPNGADVHLFEGAASREEPFEIRGLPRPRAAYAGTIDYRCDIDAILAVAERMPVIVLGHGASAESVQRLRLHANVHYLGSVPQSTVPAYLGAADVLLMPYVDNTATRFIYPQKLHEYLATGRPIVASRLPALVAWKHVVTLATTADFGHAAESVLTTGSDASDLRIQTARANSWEQRVATFEDLLSDLTAVGRAEQHA